MIALVVPDVQDDCSLTCVIQPFFDQDGASGQPCRVDVRPQRLGAVRMAVTVRQQSPLSGDVSSFGEELLSQCDQGGPPHHQPAAEQNATDTEGTQALNLSVAARKAFRGWLQRPRDGRQRHDVADEIGQRVDGVGDEGCGC